MDEIDQFIEQLTDPDMDVRWKTILALPHPIDPRLVPALTTLLQDSEAAIRARAADATRFIGVPERRTLLQLLINLLQDADAEVRANAAEALGYAYDYSVAEPLFNLLVDEDFDVRANAIASISRSAPREQRQLISDFILPQLRHADNNVRAAVAEALGNLGAVEAFDDLIDMAQHDAYQWARRNAITALSEIADLDHETPLMDEDEYQLTLSNFLIDLLNDKHDEVVEAAAEALGNLNDKDAVEALVRIFCNWEANFGPRLAALYSLGQIGDRRVVPILIAGLRDENVNLRPWAAHALGEIGDPLALVDLERVAQEDHTAVYGGKTVADAALEAIDKVHEAVIWHDLDNLIRFLHDPDHSVAYRAIEALVERAAEPRALEGLLEALNSTQVSVIITAIEFLDTTAEARALPGLERVVKWSEEKQISGLIDDARAAIDHIQRRLNGEVIEASVSTDEDEDDEDNLNPLGSISW